jgi:hypothetical protein
MRRIYVTGTTCSGKTTLATALATRLALPHVELDRLYWGPAWTPAPAAAFRASVARAVAADAWVVDGGYAIVGDIIWPRSDTVVWLDYPLPVVLGRWLRRTSSRIRSGAEFWPGTGNRETLGTALGRGSLLWWILRTHRGRRRRMLERIAAHPDADVVRLRSPRETRAWLGSLRPVPHSEL